MALPGALDMPAVATWIAACDVLTLPSWNEGRPNVILEAFACGRRVVATNVGGIPDAVSSPTLGELVPPKMCAALAAALARAARTPYDPEALTSRRPERLARERRPAPRCARGRGRPPAQAPTA